MKSLSNPKVQTLIVVFRKCFPMTCSYLDSKRAQELIMIQVCHILRGCPGCKPGKLRERSLSWVPHYLALRLKQRLLSNINPLNIFATMKQSVEVITKS